MEALNLVDKVLQVLEKKAKDYHYNKQTLSVVVHCLNALTARGCYSIAIKKVCLHFDCDEQLFSTLDENSSYWQNAMEKENPNMTAFGFVTAFNCYLEM